MSAAKVRPRLDIPSSPETLAFRAIERVLREYGPLDAQVKNWRTREGIDDDLQPPAPGLCPLISLTPEPRPGRLLTNVAATVNFAVAVEIYVAGSCVDDLLNLWGLVVAAANNQREFQPGMTVYQYLNCGIPGVQVRGFKVAEPAYTGITPGTSKKDGKAAISMQDGLGVLICTFDRPF